MALKIQRNSFEGLLAVNHKFLILNLLVTFDHGNRLSVLWEYLKSRKLAYEHKSEVIMESNYTVPEERDYHLYTYKRSDDWKMKLIFDSETPVYFNPGHSMRYFINIEISKEELDEDSTET